MTSQTRPQAIDRLRNIPEVFTLKTAAAIMGIDTNMASTYIKRWRDMGLVESLGGRTGVHFNLLRDPEGPDTRRLEAIDLVLPGSIIGGATALHAAGWTTQIPTAIDIMSPPRRTLPAIDNVESSTRTSRWFVLAQGWIERGGIIPMLDPAFALADAVKNGGWVPDSDDIEWDEVDVKKIRSAFEVISAVIPYSWANDMNEADGPGF